MRVIPINSKLFLGGCYPRGKETLPEEVKFLAGAALVIFAPALLYCAVIGQFWPLWLMACDAALGCVLGLVLFGKSSDGFPSCVPRTSIAKSQRAADAGEVRQVA